jgi:Raf kinase inhibitor-like YbhB/YbcL family protein
LTPHSRGAGVAFVLFAALAGAYPTAARAATIVVTSTAFSSNGRIPARYGSKACGGENVSPPLAWRGLPGLTRSVVVSVFDADAPGGSGFYHWLVYDVPTSVTSLASSPAGKSLPPKVVTSKNSAGIKAYVGPCPPHGQTHRYRFTVYALDAAYVQAKGERKATTVVGRIGPYLLGSGTLVGTFKH